MLGPAGYGAVQVAPPEDSISVAGHPWWDVYQPAAYDLNSRMGTRAQFTAMVSACHAAGVKVYVDAVINHMTGANQSSTTSYGGADFTNNYSYPSAGYGTTTSTTTPANCPQSDNQIHDWNNQTEVQECQLVGLVRPGHRDRLRPHEDRRLPQRPDRVGVDGFRVDAAKHINRPTWPRSRRKLTNQSVYSPGGHPRRQRQPAPAAFEGNGGVLEFNYATQPEEPVHRQHRQPADVRHELGPVPERQVRPFVVQPRHRAQRLHAELQERGTDTLANVFMLAWNFGTPERDELRSRFSNTDQSPPADGNGTSPRSPAAPAGSASTASGRSEHGRLPQRHPGDTTVGNWWSDGSNEIAFCRGAQRLDRHQQRRSAVATALHHRAPGRHVLRRHPRRLHRAASCTGPTVTVNGCGHGHRRRQPRTRSRSTSTQGHRRRPRRRPPSHVRRPTAGVRRDLHRDRRAHRQPDLPGRLRRRRWARGTPPARSR